MAPPRKFNSLASWRNGENSLHSINLTMPAARIRIHFASACPDAALFRVLAGRLAASGP